MQIPWSHHAPAPSPLHFTTLPAGATSHVSLVGIEPDAGLSILQEIIDAANSGVSVQFMLPHLSPTPPGVPSADNNETYRILSPQVAVNVTPHYFMYAKMIIADQWLAFVGSQNLSHQSLHYSREVGIRIANPSVVSRLLTTFNADWKDAQDRASYHRY